MDSLRPGGSAWNVKLLAHDNKIARALSPKSRVAVAGCIIPDMHSEGNAGHSRRGACNGDGRYLETFFVVGHVQQLR